MFADGSGSSSWATAVASFTRCQRAHSTSRDVRLAIRIMVFAFTPPVTRALSRSGTSDGVYPPSCYVAKIEWHTIWDYQRGARSKRDYQSYDVYQYVGEGRAEQTWLRLRLRTKLRENSFQAAISSISRSVIREAMYVMLERVAGQRSSLTA